MKKYRVLVMDDEVPFNRIIVDMLRKNYYTDSAYDGVSAIEMARKSRPDIVMPLMDGYEVCRVLRADPVLKDVKIIFLSARSDISDRLRAYGYGADDYIAKPFDIFELLAKIDATARRLDLALTVPPRIRKIVSLVESAVYAKSEGNRMVFYGYDNRKPIGSGCIALQEILKYFSTDFMQVNRSYLVSCNEFKALEQKVIKFRKKFTNDIAIKPSRFFLKAINSGLVNLPA